MKRATLAKIMFPTAAPLFAVTFGRFCVMASQAHQWKWLIMGIYATLAMLILFMNIWMTARRGKEVTEVQARLALANFFVTGTLVLLFATPK